MVQYRWEALPFRMAPLSEKIHGYSLDEFSFFLDTLFNIADMNNGMNPRFMKPANIFVIKNNGEFNIGMNFSKAIPGECSIHEMFGDIKSMKHWALNVLGMKVETVITIPENMVIKYMQSFNNVFDRQDNLQEFIKILRGFPEKDEELKKLVTQLNKEIVNYEGGDYMFVNPIFHSRDISVDPDLCFLVMPFNEKRKELLEKVVKPKIEDKFNLNVLKSGDIQGANQNVMENIWTYINQASMIIADMSDGNPNVFYELGICHTLGKPVILLCDEESKEQDYDGKLPFDLSNLQVIFYSNSGYGPTKLTNDVINAITNMRKQLNN